MHIHKNIGETINEENVSVCVCCVYTDTDCQSQCRRCGDTPVVRTLTLALSQRRGSLFIDFETRTGSSVKV